MFDPLDRPIPNKDDDQTLKRNQMLEKILKMPSISTASLRSNLSNELNTFLEMHFYHEQGKCNNSA